MANHADGQAEAASIQFYKGCGSIPIISVIHRRHPYQTHSSLSSPIRATYRRRALLPDTHYKSARPPAACSYNPASCRSDGIPSRASGPVSSCRSRPDAIDVSNSIPLRIYSRRAYQTRRGVAGSRPMETACLFVCRYGFTYRLASGLVCLRRYGFIDCIQTRRIFRCGFQFRQTRRHVKSGQSDFQSFTIA